MLRKVAEDKMLRGPVVTLQPDISPEEIEALRRHWAELTSGNSSARRLALSQKELADLRRAGHEGDAR